jgi:hypothetical protein
MAVAAVLDIEILYGKCRKIRSIARRSPRSRRRNGAIMKKAVKTEAVIDWSIGDAMTDEERRAAAMVDPDAVPMTDEEWAAAPRVAQDQPAFNRFRLKAES